MTGRLIDADKTLERIESWNTSDATDKALYNFALNRIVEQPTVDAVPVSFIFDKMSAINAEYVNIQRLIAAEPETVERRIGIATNLLREYNALRNLIQEWKGNKNE